jgi:hypothetical protein
MTPWFSAEFDAAHAFVGVLLSKAEDLRDGDGRFFEILRWRGRSERGAGGDKLIEVGIKEDSSSSRASLRWR